MHLSRGRIGAALHRVNVALVPPGESRVSMPFFLLPRMDGPLRPFALDGSADSADRADSADTGYRPDRDRGTNAAVNRMATFPQCTRRWWQAEFKELREQQRQEVQAETGSAYEVAAQRAKRNRARL